MVSDVCKEQEDTRARNENQNWYVIRDTLRSASLVIIPTHRRNLMDTIIMTPHIGQSCVRYPSDLLVNVILRLAL